MVKREDLPESFCPVPFTSLIYSQEGVVRCCRDQWTETLGEIRAGSELLELWNCEKIRRWRREFLEGKPVICKEAIKNRGCHLWKDELLPHVELQETQERPPVSLAPLLNGKCNLQCVMCDVWYKENGYYDRIGFWEEAEKRLFPFIKIAEIFGGEPFVQKDTFKLIERISEVNPSCRWSFWTNGHWKLNARVRGLLDRVEIDRIHFSIDSLDPEVFRRIRVGGDLARALDTLEDVREYSRERGFGVGVQIVAQRLNWEGLPALAEFAEEKGLTLVVLYARQPDGESLSTLGADEKIPVLKHWRAWGRSRRSAALEPAFRTLFDTLRPEDKLRFVSEIA